MRDPSGGPPVLLAGRGQEWSCALSLTADGARGADQAGVLAPLGELRGRPSPFAIVAGASAGAISGALVATIVSSAPAAIALPEESGTGGEERTALRGGRWASAPFSRKVPVGGSRWYGRPRASAPPAAPSSPCRAARSRSPPPPSSRARQIIPADGPRPNTTYNHPLAALDSDLRFPPTPAGNRGTYEQIVEVGPVVRGEFILPLGQSAHIEGSLGEGATFVDPNATSLHPLWRDWRFVAMLSVAGDLADDASGDGVLDGYERWYFGGLG